MSDIFEEMFNDLGIEPPAPVTPEQDFLNYLTADKHPKIYNCQYWLKHSLHLYDHCVSRGWHMSKPSGDKRTALTIHEVARHYLVYYFQMTYLPRFENERGTGIDMDKFLDLVMNYDAIKKVINTPQRLLV